MINYKNTTDKIVSQNYPYGFREKTTKTDYLEFSATKGFRHCSQTINPKTGNPNNPKKSTYYDCMLLGTDDNGHCKSMVLDFNGGKELQRSFDFLAKPEIFNLFTSQQIEFFYIQMLMYSKVNAKAQVIYCGTKWEDLEPFYRNPIKQIIEAIATKGNENRFSQFVFDWESIDKLKVPNYQPFVSTSYSIIGGQLVKD